MIRVVGVKDKLKKTTLLVMMILLALVSFSSSRVSASQAHHGHTNLSLCAALCEAPSRRQEITVRAVSETGGKKETSDNSTNKHQVVVIDENNTARRTFRPRVDKLSSLERVSVYRC